MPEITLAFAQEAMDKAGFKNDFSLIAKVDLEHVSFYHFLLCGNDKKTREKKRYLLTFDEKHEMVAAYECVPTYETRTFV